MTIILNAIQVRTKYTPLAVDQILSEGNSLVKVREMSALITASSQTLGQGNNREHSVMSLKL